MDIRSPIIFTTAYDEYALKAFKLNSIDYLLKPIDQDELQKAVEKLRRNHGNSLQINAEMIRKMLKLEKTVTYKKRFMVKVGQHLKLIPVADILCFFSAHKGTFVHTKDHREYPIDHTLEELESMVNPDAFFRINRKYMIALTAINDIITYVNSRLQLKIDGLRSDDLIVSRERVKAFKHWLQ